MAGISPNLGYLGRPSPLSPITPWIGATGSRQVDARCDRVSPDTGWHSPPHEVHNWCDACRLGAVSIAYAELSDRPPEGWRF
jgi:hypothetical protein